MIKQILSITIIAILTLGITTAVNFAEADQNGKIKVISPDQLKASEDIPKIPPGLYKRIIADTTSPKDISDFEAQGCQVVHNLNDATALKCPKSIIPSLSNVREDRLFQTHDLVRGNFPINANDVEADLGYDGSDTVVAILDTGVDASNQELSDSVIKTKNFIKGLSPHDNDGHGTHVSGIVTGNGIATITNTFGFVSPNWAKGSAPNADIIVGKVCWTLGCYESSIAKGIEWAVAQNADVLSMSLGSNEVFSGSCNGDFLAQKANWAVDQGLVVVVSSGNDDSSTGMSSPACGDQVISVGATDTTDWPYTVAAFSNSHPDGLTLVAPGVDILSTYSCRAAGDCSSNWYAWISGTSMSAPRVAGVAALVLDANPNLTPGQVKTALCVGAIEITDGLRDGCGMVNALAAVNSVLDSSNTTPTVNPQTFSVNENSPNTTPVGTVVATDPDGDTLTYSITAGNAAGGFAINAATGEITVADSAVLDFETTPSFALTVKVEDSGLLADTATITINLNDVNETPTENEAPTADAGPDQTVVQKTLVTLDGTGSYDPDNDPLSYEWVKISGPKAKLDLTDPAKPTFTAPKVGKNGKTIEFQLTVSDGEFSSSKNVKIFVTNT